VYSTLLGFMDIETAEYKAALDLFESCDKNVGTLKEAALPDAKKTVKQ
jgi:hypothetical protein